MPEVVSYQIETIAISDERALVSRRSFGDCKQGEVHTRNYRKMDNAR